MTGPVYRERQVRKGRTAKRSPGFASFAASAFVLLLVGDVRNQRDLPRALDRGLQLALVHRARAGDPARQDLAALGDERPDQLHVLVIDIVDLVRAELADLATTEERAALSLVLVSRLLVAGAAAATAARAALSEWHR